MPACVVDPVQSPLPGLVARTRKSPPAGERADLASELTRSIDCDKGLNGAKRAHYLLARRALRHAASHACARALQCDESALALVSEIFAQHEIWLAEVPLIYCS